MYSDPFSDILKLMRAETLVTGGLKAGGPWAIRFPAPEKIKFFAVIKGTCWAHIDGEPDWIHFQTGDVGLLSARRGVVLASDPGVDPVDAMCVFSGAKNAMATLGDGNDFAHLGGNVLLDPSSGRLLADALPPWIHVPATSAHATTFRLLLDRLIEETAMELPGAQLSCAHLAQLLFIQILRAHIQTSGDMPANWLRALGDTRIAPALRLIHASPGEEWRLEDLASACAMSRTTFAFHFKSVAGVAPLTYLTEWRMKLAERALREETTPVAVVARSLGYTSESAFSTAFKRLSGKSPKAYRNAARGSSPSHDQQPQHLSNSSPVLLPDAVAS